MTSITKLISPVQRIAMSKSGGPRHRDAGSLSKNDSICDQKDAVVGSVPVRPCQIEMMPRVSTRFSNYLRTNSNRVWIKAMAIRRITKRRVPSALYWSSLKAASKAPTFWQIGQLSRMYWWRVGGLGRVQASSPHCWFLNCVCPHTLKW